MCATSNTLQPAEFRTPLDCIKIGLRGLAQVMFQEHAGTGLCFLIGVAIASPLMAAGAVLGMVIGPTVAYLLKWDRREIEAGLYGFNPALVGIALLFYFRPVPLTWGLVVVGCALASVVTYLMRRYVNWPTYTAPFILVAWLGILVGHGIEGPKLNVKPAAVAAIPNGFLTAVLAGEAEVMFGANEVTGLLFLVGIALSNWRHATLAFLGSVAGTLLAKYHNDPTNSISIGIYGYDAALTAIAMYLWRKSLLIPILGALCSVPITEFFPNSLGIPPLTAPFVIASWIMLAIGALEGIFIDKAKSP